MSDEKSLRLALQDSKVESATSNAPNSSVAVAKPVTIVSDRGATFLIAALALGLASWSVARVGYLHDEWARQAVEDNKRAEQQASAFMYHATELQTDYFLHAAQQAQQTESEITHYRDKFTALERQYRMVELKLDDTAVVLHRAGLQLTGDYTRGPQGNLDAESFHISERK